MPANFDGYPADDAKTNATLSLDDHPQHHNVLAAAANFLQAALTVVQGDVTDINAAVAALVADLAELAEAVAEGGDIGAVTSDGSVLEIISLSNEDYDDLTPPSPTTVYLTPPEV